MLEAQDFLLFYPLAILIYAQSISINSKNGLTMRPIVFRISAADANPCLGRVGWSPAKSIWNMGMLLCAIVFVPFQTSVGAVILFLGFTYFTLLFGHSVGMHRALIHKSFECPKWLERILVYLGVLVGMAGPFGILKIHDVRDWAQREAKCHDFFAHRRSLLVDAFWQLNSCFHFDHPPTFIIEPAIKNDRWYQWFERTWMIQQIPIGIIFYFML